MRFYDVCPRLVVNTLHSNLNFWEEVDGGRTRTWTLNSMDLINALIADSQPYLLMDMVKNELRKDKHRRTRVDHSRDILRNGLVVDGKGVHLEGPFGRSLIVIKLASLLYIFLIESSNC